LKYDSPEYASQHSKSIKSAETNARLRLPDRISDLMSGRKVLNKLIFHDPEPLYAQLADQRRRHSPVCDCQGELRTAGRYTKAKSRLDQSSTTALVFKK
jgi:hypothetical protein